MKKLLYIMLPIVMIFSLSAQELSGFTAIGELSDGLIAVQKDGKWGFIDTSGTPVIGYRDDLAPTDEAPAFKEGLCRIHTTREGIPYYGYMDVDGQTVIEPKYLNASEFKDGHAVVLKVEEQVRGTNEYLNKNIISRNYDEVLINRMGDELKYLNPHKDVMLDARKYKQPEIISRILSEDLVATLDDQGTWKVIKY
ncbi:WG repeat-containing protein [Robertkochia flava]|uniref:WG repeat-containing protein n=1 Tax=Robertkochia flava TaxID=3447986 RepID=UPI001CCFCD7F|nr:WG repeat-containing protein [Robertkochia marina]